jgi:hypothetical protein
LFENIQMKILDTKRGQYVQLCKASHSPVRRAVVGKVDLNFIPIVAGQLGQYGSQANSSYNFHYKLLIPNLIKILSIVLEMKMPLMRRTDTTFSIRGHSV